MTCIKVVSNPYIIVSFQNMCLKIKIKNRHIFNIGKSIIYIDL